MQIPTHYLLMRPTIPRRSAGGQRPDPVGQGGKYRTMPCSHAHKLPPLVGGYEAVENLIDPVP
jgi:hypothetical protein